jgi:hypothetical protein
LPVAAASLAILAVLLLARKQLGPDRTCDPGRLYVGYVAAAITIST